MFLEMFLRMWNHTYAYVIHGKKEYVITQCMIVQCKYTVSSYYTNALCIKCQCICIEEPVCRHILGVVAGVSVWVLVLRPVGGYCGVLPRLQEAVQSFSVRRKGFSRRYESSQRPLQGQRFKVQGFKERCNRFYQLALNKYNFLF